MSGIRKDAFIRTLRGNTKRLHKCKDRITNNRVAINEFLAIRRLIGEANERHFTKTQMKEMVYIIPLLEKKELS